MADGGSTQVFRYLFSSVRCDNGSSSNAIYAQIFKTLGVILKTNINRMTWKDIKEKIYYLDGSLRDIYIQNATKADWKNWADFVNTNYRTSFHSYETEIKLENIEFSKVLEYWNGQIDNCATATVFAGNIKINAHFFTDQEIENDIAPKEVTSIDDHKTIIEYMIGVSNKLNKKVILTAENMPEVILISVMKNEVIINLN